MASVIIDLRLGYYYLQLIFDNTGYSTTNVCLIVFVENLNIINIRVPRKIMGDKR